MDVPASQVTAHHLASPRAPFMLLLTVPLSDAARSLPLQVTQSSVFCFQPIGDLMTRKGLFDAILHGCVPVTFDPLTASSMYTWHWEEEFWRDVSVEYPWDPVAKRYFDVVRDQPLPASSSLSPSIHSRATLCMAWDRPPRALPLDSCHDDSSLPARCSVVARWPQVLALKELYETNRTLIERKQALIRQRVFELQYALDGRTEALPGRTKTVADGLGGQVTIAATWPVYADGTPMRDAYDLIMDATLGWHR